MECAALRLLRYNPWRKGSGKDLILEYVKSLPDDEKTDGFSGLQCLENGEMDKIKFKR